MSYPLMTVDAAILYDTPFKIPPFDELGAELNARLARAGNSVGQTAMTDEFHVTFRSDTLYVAISFNREPLAPEGFQGALSAGINKMQDDRFPEHIKEHVGNIFITVGDGKMHISPENKQLMEKNGVLDGMMDGVVGVDPRIKISVLHSAVETVLEMIMPTPTAVHWCQSDLLHTADSFPPLSDAMPFPVTLISRPEFYDGGKTDDGRQANAIVMRHSELFCGKTLFADTTTYDPQKLMMTMHVLMLSHIIDGNELEDGTGGTINEHIQFRLEHRPPHEGIPAGGIAMIVEPIGTPPPAKGKRKNAGRVATGGARKSWWPFGRSSSTH